MSFYDDAMNKAIELAETGDLEASRLWMDMAREARIADWDPKEAFEKAKRDEAKRVARETHESRMRELLGELTPKMRKKAPV